MAASRRIKPSGGFELWWWYFMRLSGLLLVFLALGHLFITHIRHNVEVINYAFVADRWSNPQTGVLWRLWDLAMINLAVLHGANGLRQVVYESIARPSRRIIAATLLWGAALGLIGVGTFAILMFQEDKSYTVPFRQANSFLYEPQASVSDLDPSGDRY